MQSRREFLRNAAGFTAAGGLLESIAWAAAIEPTAGSTFLDAEHVVILMQENRSFDHAFGTLRGVRGFNDPRAIRLSDGLPVWAQANAAGERYVPFRLDIKNSKSTWMGCLPHAWADQVDAANGGKHDRWLHVKQSGHKEYSDMPLTMGFHTRDDIPFYYALADAFTICDQYYCSTLTGTTPNRLHLWTGTIRAKATADAAALVCNEDCEYGQWVNWKTFPERLQDAGVSWKVYQNELCVPTGLSEEEDSWLSNFGDNPLEWFTQYHVRHAERHRAFLAQKIKSIPGEIEALQKRAETEKTRKRIEELKAILRRYEKDLAEFTPENFAKLSHRQQLLHQRAFCTNAADPFYRELADYEYADSNVKRRIKVPKGDVLFQFRQDVNAGKLPAVSWLAAPERFSDHPCAAWYGQWYLSEVLNILTKNPQVWKKTIFILTYDENDGYFDHVPPFQAPHPTNRDSGQVTPGIDTSLEYLELEADRKHKPRGSARGNSLGLGFRVPMLIASPWSRGGSVCSQVFDHTSVIQLLEKVISHKTGKKIEETNITRWRRTVCGDLTSAFQKATDDPIQRMAFVERGPFIEAIHKAKFKKVPTGFQALTEQQIRQVRIGAADAPLPRQEPGVRRSSPLPYELEVDGDLDRRHNRFVIRFAAKNGQFGERSAGAPFIAYALTNAGLTARHYAVAAGQRLEDTWPLDGFANRRYHVRIHGPNGFYREFQGGINEPNVSYRLGYNFSQAGSVEVIVDNHESQSRTIMIRDLAYGNDAIKGNVETGQLRTFVVNTPTSQGWYDVRVTIENAPAWEKRYAGRVETGQWSISDPQMGRDR